MNNANQNDKTTCYFCGECVEEHQLHQSFSLNKLHGFSIAVCDKCYEKHFKTFFNECECLARRFQIDRGISFYKALSLLVREVSDEIDEYLEEYADEELLKLFDQSDAFTTVESCDFRNFPKRVFFYSENGGPISE